MRAIRVFLPQSLSAGAEVQLAEDAAHHVCKVLRLRVGDGLQVFNATDGEFAATLIDTRGKAATLHCDTAITSAPEPTLNITLVQALATGDRIDTTIQKATELGVSAVMLFRAERSQGKLSGSRQASKLAHWQRVAVAATEQCGRCSVPGVALADSGLPSPGKATSLLLDPRAEQSLADLTLSGSLQIAVGPEGGFTDEELRQAKALGWQGVRCGPRVLRTETAGPAVLAAVQALHGDWR